MDEPPKPEPPQPSTPYLDKANEIAAKLEAQLKKAEETLARQEQIIARQIFSGRAEQGAPPKEETAKEYANRILRGGK